MAKRFIAAAFIFVVVAVLSQGLTLPAVVDGVKVRVSAYHLKKPFSVPMADASVGEVLDLTEGVGEPLSTPLNFEETNVLAAELSITFENTYLHIKAYAFDDATSTYYYTTATGVESTTALQADWVGYDFYDSGEIFPNGGTDYVAQSYFPEPVLIEDGSTHVINGLVNLEYAVFFWDGNDQPIGNASWTSAVFSVAEPTFAVSELDAVLALDAELTSEVYLFAESLADLTGSDFTRYKAVALFFDATGNVRDGSGKGGTGYDVPSGASRVGAWKRIQAANVQEDGTIPFTIARDYDSTAGQYFYEYTTTGFTRISDVDMESDVTDSFTVTVDETPVTIHFLRVK